MRSIGHITWVTPERLERNWLPEYFAPRFRLADEALLSDSGDFLRLGDVVRTAGAPTTLQTPPQWLVRRRGGSMSFERPTRAEDVTEGLSSWVPLPDECVVLDAMVFDDTVAAAFWSSSILGGSAATTRTSHVLIPMKGRDIAWLEAALADPLVASQLARAALGTVLPRIGVADLLEVRLPKLSPEKERATSDMVRRALTKRSEVLRLLSVARNQRAHSGGVIAAGVPVLTAATFEQRVEQFERLLQEDQLADRGTGFLCQAARDDHESDLFVIRPIGDSHSGAGSAPPESTLRSEENEDVNEAWRQWYWDAEAGVDYAVFNAIAGGPELPTHLLIRSLASPRVLAVPAPGGLCAPSFIEYRAAIEASRDENTELDLVDAFQTHEVAPNSRSSELGRLWDRLNSGIPPTEEVAIWLRSMFRPALAIRVLREDRVAGAYLLFGADQLEDPSGAVAHAELLGERLVAILRQPLRIAEEAARSESLRRLSWMMHQLGGPLTRIGNVVEELVGFASANPLAASALLPDEGRARARAEMNELPIEEFTLRARLTKLEAAVEEIRRLRYLIRRYKNAQGELQMTPFFLRDLLGDLAGNAHGQLPELQVRIECDPGLLVEADRGLVRAALEEVVSNACRECRLRGQTEPAMVLTGLQRGNRVRVAIEDNALPIEASLLPDVFAEDASTYRSQAKGSGLGLAIVKETFLRHGSRCDLVENTTIDDSRRPGVTFWTELPMGHTAEDSDRV